MAVEPEETRPNDLETIWEELRKRGQDTSIEELCGGSSAMADEIKRRIAALQASDPIRTGTGTGTLMSTTPPSPLDVMGDMPSSQKRSAASTATFGDLRFHAEGGLGEVFMAHEGDLHRDVALKFLKRRVSHDPDSRRRFLQEAEVTGRLEHPGIVPVYSLGQDDQSQPCYAMRFIRGLTLEEAIRDFHAAGPSQQKHAFRGLIKRLVSVCNTIAYAHSRGVLHRDIKPLNIMLGKYDETLVVDWGLARPFDQTRVDRESDEGMLIPISGESTSGTPTAGAVGTPVYMSPEQSEGRSLEAGPVSDVYSLGVTLYVILTGRVPIQGRNIVEVLERVRLGEFFPPREVKRDVPRALDAICCKAMALRLEDRYASALDLADDLERWLADEPVTAFREPLLVRLGRWGRRHKTAVASVTALLATAVVAMSVATVLLNRQNQEIQRQKLFAEQQHALAEENFNHARNAVNRMLTEVGQVELADVPQMEPIRARLLDEARRFYLAFLAQEGSRPAIRRETARAHRHLGDIREMLGDYVAAEQSYRAALRFFDEAVDESPEARDERARSETSLGTLLKKSNRYQEAEAMLRAAIERRARLAAEDPGNLEFQQALAEGRYQWGTLLARLPGRRGEDERAYREALKLQEKLVSAARDKPEYRRDLARSLNNLGMLQAASGQYGVAQETYQEALKIQEALVQQAPAVPGHRWQLARTCCNLGYALAASQQPSEAEQLDEKALKLQQTLKNDFPRIPSYALELALTLNNLGLLRAKEAPARAEQAYREALALLEDLVARFPNMPDYRQKLAITHLNLAILLEPGDSQEAERAYGKARDLQERLVKQFPGVPEYRSALGRTLYSLSFVNRRGGDLAGAQRLLAAAIPHQRTALAANRLNPLYQTYLRDSLGVLAETLSRLGDHAGAADTAEEMPRVAPDEPEGYLRAAALLTRCMTLAAADRLALEQSYAQRATSLLRHAIGRGLLRNPRELDRPDFAPLNDRDDFKTLRDLLKSGSGSRTGVG